MRKMNFIWGKFPIINCPECHKRFRVDDYGLLDNEDIFTCVFCNSEFKILDLDKAVHDMFEKK